MNQRIEPFRCFGLMINCSIELSRKFVPRRKCIIAIELRESLFQVKNNVNTMPIHMVNCAYMSGLTVRLVFSKKMPIVLLRKEFIGLSLKSFCSSFFAAVLHHTTLRLFALYAPLRLPFFVQWLMDG